MTFHKRVKTIESITFPVSVTKTDIDNGKCGLVSKCMEKIAIERALRQRDPRGGDHHVKIDGGNFRFNLHGYKWRGLTPSKVKTSLIAFDKERRVRAKAEKAGKKFISKIEPHTWKAAAMRGDKIMLLTRERQEQINLARRRRIAVGKPDKKKYDLRYRVEGLGAA